MTEPIESTAAEISTELIQHEAPRAGTLFRTEDPLEVVEKATQVANLLTQLLREKGMIQRIAQSDHVKVEGWLTLGAMLGVVPVVTWTRKVDRGWEARVEARTLDGRVVGAGEAECLKDESNWKDSDDYAVRSMAQTRATSKALSGPLRFVVTLAGFSGTPAEEMSGVARGGPSGRAARPSDGQVKYLKSLVQKSKATPAQLRMMLDAVGADAVEVKAGWLEHLTGGRDGTASALIERFKQGALPDPGHPSDVPSDGFDPPDVSRDDSDLPWGEQR